MPENIDHLDFYPEGPETIGALQDMLAKEHSARQELELALEQQAAKRAIRRKRLATFTTVATLAIPPSVLGYLGYRDGQRWNKEEIESGTTYAMNDRNFAIPESAVGAFAGLLLSAASYAGFRDLRSRRKIKEVRVESET